MHIHHVFQLLSSPPLLFLYLLCLLFIFPIISLLTFMSFLLCGFGIGTIHWVVHSRVPRYTAEDNDSPSFKAHH